MEEKKMNQASKPADSKQAQPALKKKNNILLIALLAGLLVVIFALMIAGIANQKKSAPAPEAMTEPVAQPMSAPMEPVVQPEVAVEQMPAPVESAPVESAPVAVQVTAPEKVEEVVAEETTTVPEFQAPAAEGRPELPATEGRPELPAVTNEQRGTAEPKEAKDFFTRGEDYYYKGDFDNAIKDFSKATELDPKYADAYCEIGVSYMEKTDWDTAIKNLSKCIEIDPNHPKAQYAIAVSYARKPQPDVKAAREHFEKSKQLGFLYPQWFEDFLKRLEAGERFPGQQGVKQ